LVLVAVGTLDFAGEWSAANVERAVEQVVADRLAPRTIVLRSTLMPGTTARLARHARAIDASIDIAGNPEFMRQGSAVADFLRPERVVIGSTADLPEGAAVTALRRLYARLSAPMFVTDSTSAELIKVGSNAFLSMKIGFANEIARIAAATGADARAAVDGIGLDSRIGRAFLSPGPGYGGSCLPSQARALPRIARSAGVETPILDAVDRSNHRQAEWVAETVAEGVGDLSGASVSILGLTFKAGTDDIRESPALAVARALAGLGAHLTVHDPVAQPKGLGELAASGIAATSAGDAASACAGALAVVVATEWPEYAGLDWPAIARSMKGTLIVDARGIVDVTAARGAGLQVIVHGRRAEPTPV
jgi:UDPglucose 6-dehydrogenase